MSPEAETGTPEIQLHFCQRCGISIPQIDIDTGRAQAAPGGYVCVGCVYQQRETDLKTPAHPMPRPMARMPAAPPRAETGSRALVGLALLYVVGVTTFLLVREVDREPPAPVDLRSVATADSLGDLSRKVDDLDAQTRQHLAALKSSDTRQRDDIRDLSGKVNGLTAETTQLTRSVRTDIEDLRSTIAQILSRTGLVKDDVESVLRKLRALEDKVDRPAPAPGEGPTVRNDPDPKPTGPQRSAEELERERQAREYIAILRDRGGGDKGNQARYNAAVQLGDLKHPEAVPALIDALENDPYDLVRRASAWSLGSFGKDAIPAIPALIEQIGGKHEYVGYMCERALGEITKTVLGAPVGFDFDPTMSSSQRRKVQRKWEEWWSKHKAKLLPDG